MLLVESRLFMSRIRAIFKDPTITNNQLSNLKVEHEEENERFSFCSVHQWYVLEAYHS